jgi:hypothetical protein
MLQMLESAITLDVCSCPQRDRQCACDFLRGWYGTDVRGVTVDGAHGERPQCRDLSDLHGRWSMPLFIRMYIFN